MLGELKPKGPQGSVAYLVPVLGSQHKIGSLSGALAAPSAGGAVVQAYPVQGLLEIRSSRALMSRLIFLVGV